LNSYGKYDATLQGRSNRSEAANEMQEANQKIHNHIEINLDYT
jgi:hypothetical protein